MADTLQFVDSIASAPTVRLDLNDGATWLLEGPSVDFSPPPLRRAINGTLLTDGSVQSASSYDNRLLKFTLSLSGASTDAAATQLQTLMRELDRDCNYLKYLPNGASSPVFFRTLRSPANGAFPISPLGTSRRFEVEILAEPFALGLREDVAVGTVNNDPAAVSNGLFFDVSNVKGDVAAPAIVRDQGAVVGFGALASRQRGTPSDLLFFTQAESLTLGTDTTNPGGGPDAAMSGSTLNNFVRTSFGTVTASVMRLRWSLSGLTATQRKAIAGTYRVFACVRRSDTASVIQASLLLQRGGVTVSTTSLVTIPGNSTSRQIVDMGLMTFGLPSAFTPGRFSVAPAWSAASGFTLDVLAQRNSGAGTLDWDYLLLMPADTQFITWTGSLSFDIFLDGGNEQLIGVDTAGANIFDGTGSMADFLPAIAGGFPALIPNQTNRFYYIRAGVLAVGSVVELDHDKTKTGTVTVSYWPRYLYIRPAAT